LALAEAIFVASVVFFQAPLVPHLTIQA